MHLQGRLPAPYGMPSAYARTVVRRTVSSAPQTTSSWFTPLADLRGIITPNGLCFSRNHAGVPDIDPDSFRLLVHGMVRRPLVFRLDDLQRFPSTSRIHFLECSGNTSSEWTDDGRAQTVQHSHGLLSCCEWTGIPLGVLLQEAGIEPGARWILAEGADGAAFTRSIPMQKVLDDALVVYAQNGEALRPENGFPLRLVLPGYEGSTNVKWLRRLKVGRAPSFTREETARYTDLMPDGRARAFTFVMEAKSVITSPSGGERLAARGWREIRGLAWSGRGRIVRVEVTHDGGAGWHDAQLDAPVLPKCLTSFRDPWRWDGQPAMLASRCTDESGYVQPSMHELVRVRGINSGYHNNGIQRWAVDAQGAVTNGND